MSSDSRRLSSDSPGPLRRRAPMFLLGVGLGGFVDGIVLHQLLQWHHMLSADHSPTTREGLSLNVVADGVFHVGAWALVVVAALLTYRQWNRGLTALPWLEQLGLVVMGWGVFNLVEGLVNHHLLGVHHVRDDLGAPLVWDLGFLLVSALLTLVGAGMVRKGARAEGPPTRRSTAQAPRTPVATTADAAITDAASTDAAAARDGRRTSSERSRTESPS